MEMSIEFKPVSLGRLRLWMSVENSIIKMKDFGEFLSFLSVVNILGIID